MPCLAASKGPAIFEKQEISRYFNLRIPRPVHGIMKVEKSFMFVRVIELSKANPFFERITVENAKEDASVIYFLKEPPLLNLVENTRYERTRIPNLTLLAPKEPESWYRLLEPSLNQKDHDVGKSKSEPKFSILKLTTKPN